MNVLTLGVWSKNPTPVEEGPGRYPVFSSFWETVDHLLLSPDLLFLSWTPKSFFFFPRHNGRKIIWLDDELSKKFEMNNRTHGGPKGWVLAGNP